jgi:hypothetical protein
MSGVVRLGVTGHQALDADVEAWVRGELRAVVREAIGGGAELIGVTSLAPGADQWFAEEVVAAGGRLEVVIPFVGYEREIRDEAARAAYDRLLALAGKDVRWLDMMKDREDSYLLAGKIVVHASEMIVAVWDGQPARSKGGTGDAVAYARGFGRDVVHVDVAAREVRTLRGDAAKGWLLIDDEPFPVAEATFVQDEWGFGFEVAAGQSPELEQGHFLWPLRPRLYAESLPVVFDPGAPLSFALVHDEDDDGQEWRITLYGYEHEPVARAAGTIRRVGEGYWIDLEAEAAVYGTPVRLRAQTPIRRAAAR